MPPLRVKIVVCVSKNPVKNFHVTVWVITMATYVKIHVSILLECIEDLYTPNTISRSNSICKMLHMEIDLCPAGVCPDEGGELTGPPLR